MTGTRAQLSGITVTEIGGSLAGPLAGWLLAGLGASVTRIAPPGRSHDALGAMLNEGKTSHVFDLTDARDRRRATEAIASSDIVLDNHPDWSVGRTRPRCRRADARRSAVDLGQHSRVRFHGH